MRLTAKLVRVAALVAAAAAGAAGCSSSSNLNIDCSANPNGCGCPTNVTITSAQACQMIEETGELSGVETLVGGVSNGPTCRQVCPNEPQCTLPDSYVSQARALNPGASPTDDAGLEALRCPTGPATLTVTCEIGCAGRLTAGYCAPERASGEGKRLAAMAYLEAVSVHAFERLERELHAHGAPPSLLRGARRARRDEVRHTAMTARLARERGGCPRLPEAPPPFRARTLLEVALENAVEGCVRETYGAVHGLIEAQTSRDRGIRRAMSSIAADECRHAELAWAVHTWAVPRLGENERLHVERAMRDAIAEIAARDPRTASLLFS